MDCKAGARKSTKARTAGRMAITGRHGVGDKLAEALRHETNNLTSMVAEDSGHFVAEEVPDFFCDHLVRFLSA